MHHSTTVIITATEITQMGSDQSIDLYVLQVGCHELFCVFGDFYASGKQDAEGIKSLGWWGYMSCNNVLIT